MNRTDQTDDILLDLMKTASVAGSKNTRNQTAAGSIQPSMPTTGAAPAPKGMRKEDITLDMRVYVQGYGRGTVIDLMPANKFYVRVKYDLDAYPKCRGQEMNAEIAVMKPLPPPKKTIHEKSQAKWGAIVASPLSYFIAGVAAKGPVKFAFSTPQKDEEKTRTYLDAHHVDDSIVSVSAPLEVGGAQGPTYTLVMSGIDKDIADEFKARTEVHASTYQGGPQITWSSKEFVVEFLCSVLKFDPKLKNQSIAAIRAHVPKEFLAEFDKGAA